MLCCVVPPHLTGLYDYCRSVVYVCVIVSYYVTSGTFSKLVLFPSNLFLCIQVVRVIYVCFVSQMMNESFDITYMD